MQHFCLCSPQLFYDLVPFPVRLETSSAVASAFEPLLFLMHPHIFTLPGLHLTFDVLAKIGVMHEVLQA